MSSAGGNVIEVRNLTKHFFRGLFRRECVKAVDGVSFHIPEGESLGLIGESGSGKSTLGRCMLRLIEPSDGQICFQGKDILAMNGNLSRLRQKMQIIFQDTAGSLNPRMKVKDLLLEPLRVHKLLNGQIIETAAELMKQVHLSADLLERYPNELSGGQRQRIGIARAISINPEFIIADEAIASMDVLGQAQMIELMNRLKSERGISFLNISHNIGSIRRITDRLAVMYFGRFVEIGNTKDILNNPAHPYTQILLSAKLKSDSSSDSDSITEDILHHTSGCLFYQRCFQAKSVCRYELPPQRCAGSDHRVWCHISSG